MKGKGCLYFVFEGEVDWPLPKRAGIIIKNWRGCQVWYGNEQGYDGPLAFLGFKVLSSPISQTLSDIAVRASG